MGSIPGSHNFDSQRGKCYYAGQEMPPKVSRIILSSEYNEEFVFLNEVPLLNEIQPQNGAFPNPKVMTNSDRYMEGPNAPRSHRNCLGFFIINLCARGTCKIVHLEDDDG